MQPKRTTSRSLFARLGRRWLVALAVLLPPLAARAAVDPAEAEARLEALVAPQNAVLAAPAPDNPQTLGAPTAVDLAGARVELPLAAWEAVVARWRERQAAAARAEGPAVVLGAAHYAGRAVPGALALTLDVQVTLGRPDVWKTVPLVGEDVVLVSASLAGQPLPVSVRQGFHVWITQQTGAFTLRLEILVPARGPRGSIEYDFVVLRTPVTTFTCRFPGEGLEPRVEEAVQSEIATEAGETVLSATLRPTARIHLVGFRDLGDQETAAARTYVETLNLLSIDEDALDLFSVIRYTILYAGKQSFRVAIPAGYRVVSADGEGAFRYTLETEDGETVLKGETAFPIRNAYEISLRLRRELAEGGEVFPVPLPRCLDIEREVGWLAVEVPGNLRLDEEKRGQALAVDVRQLPGDMVNNAVSPILRAYRYHTPRLDLQLRVARLPEKEPATGSIDRVRAFTVVSSGGQVLTELRLTLRNRLRHSLAITLPPGFDVRSTLLDGRPVKASRDETGRLVLPLKRSAGQGRLKAFTLQVVLAATRDELGWVGEGDFVLPAVDLPVSSLHWSVFLPGQNLYGDLDGDVAPQVYAGRAVWRQPPVVDIQTAFAVDNVAAQQAAGPVDVAPQAEASAESAETGAMPVRIQLPKTGVRREYARYWIEAGTPVHASVRYMSSWLRLPLAFVLAVLCAFGLTQILGARRVRRWLGVGLAAATLWPLLLLGGPFALVLAVMAAVLYRLWRGKHIVEWPRALAGWVARVARLVWAWRPDTSLGGLRLAGRIAVAVLLGVLLLFAADSAWRLLLRLLVALASGQ